MPALFAAMSIVVIVAVGLAIVIAHALMHYLVGGLQNKSEKRAS
jgi:hypothetical protein